MCVTLYFNLSSFGAVVNTPCIVCIYLYPFVALWSNVDDSFRNVWFCEVFTANLTGGVIAISSPNSSLRSVQIDEVLATERFLFIGECHFNSKD